LDILFLAASLIVLTVQPWCYIVRLHYFSCWVTVGQRRHRSSIPTITGLSWKTTRFSWTRQYTQPLPGVVPWGQGAVGCILWPARRATRSCGCVWSSQWNERVQQCRICDSEHSQLPRYVSTVSSWTVSIKL